MTVLMTQAQRKRRTEAQVDEKKKTRLTKRTKEQFHLSSTSQRKYPTEAQVDEKKKTHLTKRMKRAVSSVQYFTEEILNRSTGG